MKHNLLINFYVLSISIINCVRIALSNEVSGCGGFIKSHTDINFSKIEIKLYTKQGSLKDKTDCSPSNGYYFIPIYDKGEYILKISPPNGWSFEPEQVELNFNGKTDICSQGKDVNFIFKGFGITGKVNLVINNTNVQGNDNENNYIGMKDVRVELKSLGNNDNNDTVVLRKTVTDINGIFSFTPIIPGKYIIKVSHTRWYFIKSEYKVDVKSGNTELPSNALLIGGFDVEGKIHNNNNNGQQKYHNVAIGLLKEKNQKLLSNCNSENKEQLNNLAKLLDTNLLEQTGNYDQKIVCTSRPDKNGVFVFPGVAPGKYLIVPLIVNEHLKLNIEPKFIKFKVERDMMVLKDIFEIIGFSIPGVVLSSQNGKGIENAIIKLDNQYVTKTDKNGRFMLENIKNGFYTMQIMSDDYKFNDQTIEITMLNPSLKNIIASSYKVCGQIISDDSHVIGITKHDKTFHINLSTDLNTGNWCTFLPTGKYYAEVLNTENDKTNNAHQIFFPLKHTIDVQDSPISGILFSQLRVTLTGVIKCLPDSPDNCKNIEVTLQAIDSSGSLSDEVYVTNAKDGKYEFTNILPGPYEISILQSNLCWDATKYFLNIMTANETVPPFIHKGYEISVISSHQTKMQYKFRSLQKSSKTSPSNDVTKIVNLMSGVNTFCVEFNGDYDIELFGCHQYNSDNIPKKFSTLDKNPIIINAIAHKYGIRILSTESNIDSFNVLLEYNNNNDNDNTKEKKQMIKLTKDKQKIDNYNSYSYDLYLKPDDHITLQPQSQLMLFKPDIKNVTGNTDCIDVGFSFIAFKGLIINGKIQPPIQNVKIFMNFPKNSDIKSLETITNINGEFKFQPIDKNLEIELKAEKESYIFSEYDYNKNIFKAYKLCDIIVVVKDENNQKLSGVLLSLSGGENYRKNLITGNDGVIKFHSLTPNQYFLRPMMKEYKFNPNSKLIDVKDGETVQVELIGQRVAFSVFGTIASLNGDVFPNVIVEAISDEKCMHHQEESTTELNGQYRIRGLQPQCIYTIRMKKDLNGGDGGGNAGDNSIGSNLNVERSIPTSRQIKILNNDIKNINLIAISPINVVDINVRIYASSVEYYKTLKIQMYRKGSNSDDPVYSQRIDSLLLKTTGTTTNPTTASSNTGQQLQNHQQQYQQLQHYDNHLNPGVMVFLPRLTLDYDKYYVIELKTTMSDKLYNYQLPIQQIITNSSSIYVELHFQPELKMNDTDLNQNSISALLLILIIGIGIFKQNLAIDIIKFLWFRINIIINDIKIINRNNNDNNLRNNKKLSSRYNNINEQINYKEIEQLAEGINAIKKKKPKKT